MNTFEAVLVIFGVVVAALTITAIAIIVYSSAR